MKIVILSNKCFDNLSNKNRKLQLQFVNPKNNKEFCKPFINLCSL